VILETYQGGTAAFAPPAYIQTLRKWCDGHRAVLVMDEVQAGFGRTGTMWGFEHYGVLPDMVTWGKGLSSSLPISAVVGKAELMDLHGPGTATSTHSGNPVCAAAALANVELVVREDLAGQAARLGPVLQEGLRAVMAKHWQAAWLAGKGLVAGLACVSAHKEPDGELARAVVARCVEKGLLMFNPVGPMGCTIKICPPLVITEDAVKEGCAVLGEAFDEALAERSRR
jgi:4-aminobutyrate aminotransferase-like enzyme